MTGDVLGFDWNMMQVATQQRHPARSPWSSKVQALVGMRHARVAERDSRVVNLCRAISPKLRKRLRGLPLPISCADTDMCAPLPRKITLIYQSSDFSRHVAFDGG